MQPPPSTAAAGRGPPALRVTGGFSKESGLTLGSGLSPVPSPLAGGGGALGGMVANLSFSGLGAIGGGGSSALSTTAGTTAASPAPPSASSSGRTSASPEQTFLGPNISREAARGSYVPYTPSFVNVRDYARTRNQGHGASAGEGTLAGNRARPRSG